MSGSTEPVLTPPKLLQSTGAKVRIALASALILGAGAWLAPRQPARAVPPVDERAAPLLQEQVQRRTPPSLAVNLLDVAERARPLQVEVQRSATRLPPVAADYDSLDVPAAPPGAGFFVAPEFVLAHDNALNGRVDVDIRLSSGALVTATFAVYDPSTGFVLLRSSASVAPPAPVLSEPIALGQTLVAFGRRDGRDVAVPVVVVSVNGDRWELNADRASLMPAMPVYTLAGQLAAIILRDDEQARAAAAQPVIDQLVARARTGRRRLSFGLAYQDLTGAVTPLFGEKGIVVTHVVVGSPGDQAGLLPGDVLVAIGDAVVTSTATAASALASLALDTPTSVTTHRRGQSRTVTITPALAYAVAALERAAPERTAPVARALFPADDLARAGIAGAARVLALDGRTVTTRAQVDQARRRATAPLPVLLQQGDVRFFAAIEPRR